MLDGYGKRIQPCLPKQDGGVAIGTVGLAGTLNPAGTKKTKLRPDGLYYSLNDTLTLLYSFGFR
jgi:hypothetical protein